MATNWTYDNTGLETYDNTGLETHDNTGLETHNNTGLETYDNSGLGRTRKPAKRVCHPVIIFLNMIIM